MTLSGLLAQTAARVPGQVALRADLEVWTYREVDLAARRLAGTLWGWGLRPGDHVGLILPNVPAFTIAYFGAQYAGCPVVPLHPQLTAPEVAYQLRDAEARAVVAWGRTIEPVLEAISGIPGLGLVLTDQAVPSPIALEWNRALEGPAVDTPVQVDEDETAVILYTSGTTGRPKGAELSHANLEWNARYMAEHFMPEGQETVSLGVLPLCHSFGQTVIQNATFAAGGTVVLIPRFSPGAALRAIARHAVTFFAGVPSMYLAMLRYPGSPDQPFRTVSHCISGGAPMPVEVLNEFERWTGVSVLEGYGLSETSPVAAQNRIGRPRKPGSIGLPLDGVEFRLVDERGGVISKSGTPGEIEIRGPIVMKGYWRRPEASAEAIVDGWFRTGDVAFRDADGDYFIVDRKKDLILRGGMNVYPREVEEVLYGHETVSEAGVFGMPDARLGEIVCAVVVPREGRLIRHDELVAHCRERLAPYKCPQVVRVATSLPRGPTGKLLRRSLRTWSGTAQEGPGPSGRSSSGS